MTAADWPYDADRDDPLTALRIPVVDSSHPEWNYIVAFLGVDLSPYSWGSAERPTDLEACSSPRSSATTSTPGTASRTRPGWQSARSTSTAAPTA